MALPFFYIAEYNGESHLILSEETSRHIVQVLRMCAGELLNLTDGKGNLLTCQITEANKKHCGVEVKSKIKSEKPNNSVSIAISLLKNNDRFEWFLEKATEIGVAEIIPLLCERTEKEKFRFERLNGICISAMLQSQQTWLPLLQEPVAFNTAVTAVMAEQKFIAHCEEGLKNQITRQAVSQSATILIGPEGDFSPSEIKLALQEGFMPVSLGETRLRTETAGIVAATLLVL